jgi:hypothetical protein
MDYNETIKDVYYDVFQEILNYALYKQRQGYLHPSERIRSENYHIQRLRDLYEIKKKDKPLK